MLLRLLLWLSLSELDVALVSVDPLGDVALVSVDPLGDVAFSSSFSREGALIESIQREISEIMATGNNINEVKALMSKVKDTFHKYVLLLLRQNNVGLEELIPEGFKKFKQLSTQKYYREQRIK